WPSRTDPAEDLSLRGHWVNSMATDGTKTGIGSLGYRMFRRSGLRFADQNMRKLSAGESPGAHAVEQPCAGKAVGDESGRHLIALERRAGAGVDAAVRLATDVEAVPDQQLLQLETLGAGEHALLARPRAHQRRIAAQPVGEMADRERIGF